MCRLPARRVVLHSRLSLPALTSMRRARQQCCAPPLAKASEAANLAPSDPAFADHLDAQDALAPLRDEFNIPGGGIYLCAHALGPPSKRVATMLAEEASAWATVGCLGHSEHPNGDSWGSLDRRYASVLGDIVGALPSEVVLMGGLTSNLHLILASFYLPDKSGTGRHKIIYEANAFSSDRFAFASKMKLAGLDPETSLVGVAPREGEETLRTEDILAVIEKEGPETSLVLFGAVQWYNGQFLDLEAITRAGKLAGCMVGWDCAHAVGNVPLRLHDWGVDFAVWCTYKYLNSGPGSTAAIFVHENHFDRMRLAGWWGHELATRFGVAPKFKPRHGAAGFAVGNPSVFAIVPVHVSLAILEQVSAVHALRHPPPLSNLRNGQVGPGNIMPLLETKTILLVAYFEYLLTNQAIMGDVALRRFAIVSPLEVKDRSACFSLTFHPPAGEKEDGDHSSYSPTLLHVCKALGADGIIVDKRAPNLIRFSPSALYNTFAEIWRTVAALRNALE